jgi:hypothetical protein
VVRVIVWESHVSLVLALCIGRVLDDSSVQVMALAEHALADIPLKLLALATLSSLELLALSLGSLVESIGQCSTLHVILWFRLFHIPIS